MSFYGPDVSAGNVPCGWKYDCGKMAVTTRMDPARQIIPICADCERKFTDYYAFFSCG